MSLIDMVKSVAKEDADLGELEATLGTFVDLKEVSKDNILDVFKKHPSAFSALDSVVSKRAETSVENFKTGKMQEEWKAREDALRSELNPEEDKADKVEREFEAYKAQIAAEKQDAVLKDRLSEVAKEMDFPDPLLFRPLSALGDKAEETMIKFIDTFNSTLTSRLSAEVKNKFMAKSPSRTIVPPADLDAKIREARAAGNSKLALRLQMEKERNKAQ